MEYVYFYTAADLISVVKKRKIWFVGYSLTTFIFFKLVGQFSPHMLTSTGGYISFKNHTFIRSLWCRDRKGEEVWIFKIRLDKSVCLMHMCASV